MWEGEERLGGSIFFVEDIVFYEFGEGLLFLVNVACAGNVQILPEKALSVDERLDKLFQDFILDIHEFKQKLDDAGFFALIFLQRQLLFILTFQLVPRILYLQRKITLTDTQDLVHFSQAYVRYPAYVPSCLGFLGTAVTGCGRLKEVLDVTGLLTHQGLYVVESIVDLDDGARNIVAVLKRISGCC